MLKKHSLILSIALLVLLSGCGTAAASPFSGNERPTTLQVRRINLISANHYSPFYSTTINDQYAVQNIYNSIVTLPHLILSNPPHATSCPADLGLEYQLAFFQKASLLEDVIVHIGGCQLVTIGKKDVRIYDRAFVKLLAQKLGISETRLVPRPLFACTPHSPCPSSNPLD